MNWVALAGAWVLGALVVAMMRWSERVSVRRFEQITDGVDTEGVVTASRVTSGQHMRTVFDVRYPDRDGAEHDLRGLALTGHLRPGSTVAVRLGPRPP